VRVSLSLEAHAGECSRCEAEGQVILHFAVTTDEEVGDLPALCVACAIKGGEITTYLAPLNEKPSRRKAFKKAKKTSLKQEVEVCELLGARTQPGSGNQAGAKGDGRRKGELRIEAKFTKAASYSLKLEELGKLMGEATHGELPVFVIDYLDPGTSKLRDRYAVLPFADAQELIELRREKNGATKHR